MYFSTSPFGHSSLDLKPWFFVDFHFGFILKVLCIPSRHQTEANDTFPAAARRGRLPARRPPVRAAPRAPPRPPALPAAAAATTSVPSPRRSKCSPTEYLWLAHVIAPLLCTMQHFQQLQENDSTLHKYQPMLEVQYLLNLWNNV